VKKKIGEIEYTIIPIPPHLSPFSTRIGELLQKRPQSTQEAKDISKEISEVMELLLPETVMPKPDKQHYLQVFNTLIDLTNKTMEEAEFFRKNKGPKSAKGNGTVPAAAQAT